jgi:hypothetical protein
VKEDDFGDEVVSDPEERRSKAEEASNFDGPKGNRSTTSLDAPGGKLSQTIQTQGTSSSSTLSQIIVPPTIGDGSFTSGLALTNKNVSVAQLWLVPTDMQLML